MQKKLDHMLFLSLPNTRQLITLLHDLKIKRIIILQKNNNNINNDRMSDDLSTLANDS